MVSTRLVTLASSACCLLIAYLYIGLFTNTTLGWVVSYIPYIIQYRFAKQIGGKGAPTCGEGVKGRST